MLGKNVHTFPEKGKWAKEQKISGECKFSKWIICNFPCFLGTDVHSLQFQCAVVKLIRLCRFMHHIKKDFKWNLFSA